VRQAEARATALQSTRAELERLASATSAGPPLSKALRTSSVAVLAEVKRRSPSKGSIGESLDSLAQTQAYARGGAAGVSILTEPEHFGGSIDDLRHVRSATTIPVLKKDFHVAEVQLLEARACGASAALLIVRALSPEQLERLATYGREIGLELLVEVRDEEELARALDAGATMIGVNNRNLETLVIDPATAERLIPLVPRSVVAIAESGVRERADVERYAACGADAVLVGSALSAAADPAAATRALVGVRRKERHG
jgi:indole-3-glycerol phosphate synthase